MNKFKIGDKAYYKENKKPITYKNYLHLFSYLL